jgi:hypothetical protein
MTRADAELAALLAEVREFEHTLGDLTFRLRLPSKDAVRMTYARLGDGAPIEEKMGAVLKASLLWVVGATHRDLGLDRDDPLPRTAYAAAEYVAEHLEVADELVLELFRRLQDRLGEIEGDAKN